MTCYVAGLALKPLQNYPLTYNVSSYDFQSRPLRPRDHLASRLSTCGLTSRTSPLSIICSWSYDLLIILCDLFLNPYKSIAQPLCDLSLISTSFNKVVDLSGVSYHYLESHQISIVHEISWQPQLQFPRLCSISFPEMLHIFTMSPIQL